MLSEVLDGIVHELLETALQGLGLVEQGSRVVEIVQEFQELPHILLAVIVTVWLVEQLESLDKDFQALLNHSRLHSLVTEELFQDFNRGHAEITVAK